MNEKGIRGKILTTDYLNFNDPNVLDLIHSYKNIELRIYKTSGGIGFHTKGYIFKQKENYQIIIGSSNLTDAALMKNKEWNVKVSSLLDKEYVDNVLAEFYDLWNSERTESYDEFISTYREEFEYQKRLKRSLSQLQREAKKNVNLKDGIDVSNIVKKLHPNSMQCSVIERVQNLIALHQKRGLLISATGTGKTYAAAFSMQAINPRRVLFLVHREQILRQAEESFQKVLGNSYTYGILSGNQKDYEVDYLFSTVQMMGRRDVYEHFKPDDFDIILIDEVHRAGSVSYQRIIDYFRPKFLMGMTASPERTDGFDIYGLFDHNIIYEIRLQQALEEDLLCPFHYYGITDILFDDNNIGTESFNDFRLLAKDSRVDHIIEKAKHYGYSGDRVKGLVFCSRKTEAYALSEAFNKRGYKTVCLSGDDSQVKREDCIKRLVTSESDNKLDYIFSVDIFNEGVDIPAVNQVIMLRPTESPIVFVQQLGRGLRKSKQKDFVVIIDFIGNYTTNFMIPMALSGDKSYNKDTLRRYVAEGNRIIPGCSTLYFDKIAKERIYNSIDSANFSNSKLIKDAYLELKHKLGHIPSLMEFEEHGSIDVSLMFNNKTFGSYHAFKKKVEKNYTVKLTKQQELTLNFISTKIANAKRPHELLVLQYLLEGKQDVINLALHTAKTDYNLPVVDKSSINLVNVMTNDFITGAGSDTYKECVFIEPINGGYNISTAFAHMLENEAFCDEVKDLVKYGLYQYENKYRNHYKDSPFTLYEKYSYDDVCRLLEWSKSVVAQNIGGYKYHRETNTYPVFINYHKSEEISDTIQYEDKFLSPKYLQAISKSRRSIQSDDVQAALHADENNTIMDLFVRKTSGDKGAKEFYYLGRIHATKDYEEFYMTDKVKAVELKYELEVPVREDIYNYIING